MGPGAGEGRGRRRVRVNVVVAGMLDGVLSAGIAQIWLIYRG